MRCKQKVGHSRAVQRLHLPTSSRGIEDEVAFGPLVHSRSIGSSVRFGGRILRWACRHHCQSPNRGWSPVPLPPNEARDALAQPHSSSFINPVIRHRANPVGTTSAWGHIAPSAQQQALGWTLMWKCAHRWKSVDHPLITRPKIIHSTEGAAPNARRTLAKLDSSTARIAREKSQVESTRDAAPQILVHLNRVILIMANR